MAQYEINLQKLFLQLKRLLAPETLVIWTTSMPVAEYVRGGFLMEEISFMSAILRLDILSANYYASQVVNVGHFYFIYLFFEARVMRYTNGLLLPLLLLLLAQMAPHVLFGQHGAQGLIQEFA